MSYYNIHTHTDGSNTRLLDCINKIDLLIDTAYDLGLLGIAITDHENLINHVKAEEHLAKRQKENPTDERWQNFKVILGNEIYLCRNGLNENNFDKTQDAFYHFILLALDEEGHKQIRELSTKAFKQSWYKNMLRVPTYYSDIEEIIGKNPGHVWGSTACLGGYFAKCVLNNDFENGGKFVDWCQSVFGDCFSLEMQPSREPDQILVNNMVYKTAIKRNIPYVISTDAHYLRPDDRRIHKAFLNSKDGERETDKFYATAYLMTERELNDYIDGTINTFEDNYVARACENTHLIAKKLKKYSLIKKTKIPYLPFEILEPGNKEKELIEFIETNISSIPNLKSFMNSEEQADRQLSYKILDFIRKNISYIDKTRVERIETELYSIIASDSAMQLKWSKYLLQVADYVDIFWNDGDTIVGPARGSGAGFYINYILEISQVDPTREKANMFSWRFLNPERASLLDIDTDIQGNRRNKCIKALKNKYGEFRAVEVVTFGTEKAKSAIKTAARGLGVDVDVATYLSSFIESDRGIQRTLHQTFYGDDENGFAPNRTFQRLMRDEYPQLWEIAQRIESLITRLG